MFLGRLTLQFKIGVYVDHCVSIVEKLLSLAGGESDGEVSIKSDCVARIGHIWDHASRIGLNASPMPD